MIRSDLTETMERLHPGLLGAMEPALSPPLYDRSGRSKVVHIGVGAFHRAHQAFLTACFEQGRGAGRLLVPRFEPRNRATNSILNLACIR